ncbi:thioredoxin family protein [Pseudomonas abieticivorans]|uniref:thioredoxin family protein n=1 Tax=Pseudomonas abieticivorans TaxID=2931382 RepID=UPI0020C06C34|nr:thioredoxin family protein [Pseudomonas sp. PIA16]
MDACVTALTTLEDFTQKAGFDGASLTFKPGKPRVVMLKSEGCSNCRDMQKTLERWASEHQNIDVYILNTEGNGAFLRPLGITAVPTQLFIDKNGSMTEVVGGESEPNNIALRELSRSL